jgi:hypothetical protein
MSSIKCEICNENKSKYKCPRCSIQTCSLDCCKKHKTVNDCSGKRDVTAFKARDEFNQNDLMSDYNFLEEQARLVDLSKRIGASEEHHQSKIAATSSAPPPLEPKFESLKKFVYDLWKIKLNFMPKKATKHELNKTKFKRTDGIVSWSIEFIFDISILNKTIAQNVNEKE